ncbi:hypothetical protein B9Y66_12000 [Stenotrophomonas maltophilia]|nr:hypothetical protein [Stenotrophomonas sp. PA-6-5C]PJL11504.1 hypothetical protein B9Y66_12000 [Stenotrophomonas maltophilia]
MPSRNLIAVAVVSMTVLLAGCVTPPAPEPRGKWRPVNRLSDVTHAIPLQQTHVYQSSPTDSTLKGLLTRWAKDGGMTLSYLHPNDYTLYVPVGDIRTTSIVEAAAELSRAYAGQGVVVSVEKSRIIVSVAGGSTDVEPLPAAGIAPMSPTPAR